MTSSSTCISIRSGVPPSMPAGKGLTAGPRQGLDVAHRVVAEIARQAAAETRHAGAQRDVEARLVLLDECQRVAVMGFADLAVVQHLGARAAGADHRARRQADERIAAEALAAHHRFHQAGHAAGLGAGMGQLQVDAQRRVQVGIGLGHQRDAVVALGGEGFEFDFGHVGSRRRWFAGVSRYSRGFAGFRIRDRARNKKPGQVTGSGLGAVLAQCRR